MKEMKCAPVRVLLAAACFAAPLAVVGAQPAAADVEVCGRGPFGHARGCVGTGGAHGCVSGPFRHVQVCGDDGDRGRWRHGRHYDDDDDD